MQRQKENASPTVSLSVKDRHNFKNNGLRQHASSFLAEISLEFCSMLISSVSLHRRCMVHLVHISLVRIREQKVRLTNAPSLPNPPTKCSIEYRLKHFSVKHTSWEIQWQMLIYPGCEGEIRNCCNLQRLGYTSQNIAAILHPAFYSIPKIDQKAKL